MVARSLAVALLVVVLLPRGLAVASQAACPHGSTPLGRVAFVHSRALAVLDLDSCTQRVLARGIKTPVQIAWSADGKWIAAGNTVVGASDGRIAQPFGRLRREESLGIWAPRGHVLARITARGGLMLGGPGLRSRRVLADGWGVSGVLYARDGTLAVSRDLRSGTGVGRPQRQEIWLLRTRTMRPRLLYRVPRGRDTPPQLAAVSTGGRAVFFWPFVDHANSANLDGLPLEAVAAVGHAPQRIVRWMLARPDFLSWCGRRLVAAAGFDRMATVHKSLIVVSSQGWRKRTLEPAGPLSWITPSCTSDGRAIAAAAGPNREDIPFGRDARSIWIVSLDGGARTKLAPPPRGESDELPRWSRDGRFILFVRGGPTNKNAAAPGHLYLVETGATHRVYGPLASLGLGGNYYGQYGWDWDWYQPLAR